VSQDDRLIFTMMASFHAEEPGREYLRPMPAGVVDPEDLPALDGTDGWDPGIEMRPIDAVEPTMRYWCRTTDDFPPDRTLHEAGLLYASDLRAGGAAMLAIGFVPFGAPAPGSSARPARGTFGSLDHALWFHRRPRVDDWFFCEVQPIAVRDARGLVLGTMFDRAGNHIATFTQEMFLKPEAEA
jgi:acyl-CoA thioesterase-2